MIQRYTYQHRAAPVTRWTHRNRARKLLHRARGVLYSEECAGLGTGSDDVRIAASERGKETRRRVQETSARSTCVRYHPDPDEM